MDTNGLVPTGYIAQSTWQLNEYDKKNQLQEKKNVT